jgi:biopolymer transport protein TolR
MAIKTGGGYLSEINVTPFVDVMLVLLIIFMVTAPLLSQGMNVDLPQTKAVKSLPRKSENMVLTVRKDGDIYLDEYKVGVGELKAHLTRYVTAQNRQLFLKADKDVPYGVVVRIMGEIKEAGIEKLGIVAEPEKKEVRP